jgi:hypothetical protein
MEIMLNGLVIRSGRKISDAEESGVAAWFVIEGVVEGEI